MGATMKSEKGWAIWDTTGIFVYSISMCGEEHSWIKFLARTSWYKNIQAAKKCGYRCISIVIQYEEPKKRKVKKHEE